MKHLVRSALHWLGDTRLARRVVESIFRRRARRRLVELDHQSVARCQNRTLLGLVNKAYTTRFGRDHDFRRIRCAQDFQRLVPLRTPAELWREYWQSAFPHLAGATWPGPLSYLAVSTAQHNGPFPYVPVSPALWVAQQTATLTALAFVMHARPRARLCSGRLFLLGGPTTLTPLDNAHRTDRVEAIAIRELPAMLRPYANSADRLVGDLDGLLDDSILLDLAERSATMPVTCLAGTVDRLTRFFAHLRRLTGRQRVAEIWPRLTAVFYARGAAVPDRTRLLTEVGDPAVLCLEMYSRPEGAIAIEDPRYGRLRLLPDHGVYFEFVPLDQLGKPHPVRFTAADVEVDVPYALALTSPAGIWACLVGSVIRFERLDPPLLRLVDLVMPWEQSAPGRASSSPPLKATPLIGAQPPHLRTAGSAVMLPETLVRSAWSARADQG